MSANMLTFCYSICGWTEPTSKIHATDVTLYGLIESYINFKKKMGYHNFKIKTSPKAIAKFTVQHKSNNSFSPPLFIKQLAGFKFTVFPKSNVRLRLRVRICIPVCTHGW